MESEAFKQKKTCHFCKKLFTESEVGFLSCWFHPLDINRRANGVKHPINTYECCGMSSYSGHIGIYDSNIIKGCHRVDHMTMEEYSSSRLHENMPYYVISSEHKKKYNIISEYDRMKKINGELELIYVDSIDTSDNNDDDDNNGDKKQNKKKKIILKYDYMDDLELDPSELYNTFVLNTGRDEDGIDGFFVKKKVFVDGVSMVSDSYTGLTMITDKDTYFGTNYRNYKGISHKDSGKVEKFTPFYVVRRVAKELSKHRLK